MDVKLEHRDLPAFLSDFRGLRDDELDVPSPVSRPPDQLVHFVLRTADDAIALEGTGEVELCVDHGRSVPAEERYEVTLRLSRLEEQSKVVVERLRMVRAEGQPTDEEGSEQWAARLMAELEVVEPSPPAVLVATPAPAAPAPALPRVAPRAAVAPPPVVVAPRAPALPTARPSPADGRSVAAPAPRVVVPPAPAVAVRGRGGESARTFLGVAVSSAPAVPPRAPGLVTRAPAAPATRTAAPTTAPAPAGNAAPSLGSLRSLMPIPTPVGAAAPSPHPLRAPSPGSAPVPMTSLPRRPGRVAVEALGTERTAVRPSPPARRATTPGVGTSGAIHHAGSGAALQPAGARTPPPSPASARAGRATDDQRNVVIVRAVVSVGEAPPTTSGRPTAGGAPTRRPERFPARRAAVPAAPAPSSGAEAPLQPAAKRASG